MVKVLFITEIRHSKSILTLQETIFQVRCAISWDLFKLTFWFSSIRFPLNHTLGVFFKGIDVFSNNANSKAFSSKGIPDK